MNQNVATEKRDATYRIMGTKIYFAPTPSWTGSVRLWYLPAPVSLSSDNTTVDGISGFEEYIVLHALLQYCGKAEEDPTLFASQLGTLKQAMVVSLNRDNHEPDRVRDAWAEAGMSYTRRGNYPRLGGA